MKKTRSCRMKPQPKKRLRSTKIMTKNMELPTDLGIGLDGTMIIGLRCQPHDHILEEIFGQVIRSLTISDKIDLSNEEATRITTIIGIMTTEQTHHTIQTKTNPGIGDVTKAIHDHLQPHDKIPLSQISADNPDQYRLILQCLTHRKQDPSNNIPYDMKFPTFNDSNQPNMVRFTTTDDEIKKLSGLCPLSYQGLRVQLLISPRIQDSASTFSTSPPETLKKIVA